MEEKDREIVISFKKTESLCFVFSRIKHELLQEIASINLFLKFVKNLTSLMYSKRKGITLTRKKNYIHDKTCTIFRHVKKIEFHVFEAMVKEKTYI